MFFLCLPLLLPAQWADSSRIRMDGTLKTRVEWSTSSGEMRFNLRNARVGASGVLNRWVGYRMQAELNSEGQFAVLDGFVDLRPVDRLLISIGQTAVPFENAYLITPSEMQFANRVFIGKFFTPSSRDIGVKATYRIDAGWPVTLLAGVFNGGVLNNPRWTRRPSVALSAQVGSIDHFRATLKLYRYPGERNNWLFWGADVSYLQNGWLVQAEVMCRHDYDAPTADTRRFTGAYLQTLYTIPVQWLTAFRSVVPAFRWDAMAYGLARPGANVHRLTAGLSFDLTGRLRNSCLRLNFEQYLVHDAPPAWWWNEHIFDDKMTAELLVKF